MEETKVSQKGQVVIPKEFRDMFGIKEGGEVVMEAVDNGVLIMKKEKNPVKAMTGMFEGRFKKSSTFFTSSSNRTAFHTFLIAWNNPRFLLLR